MVALERELSLVRAATLHVDGTFFVFDDHWHLSQSVVLET